MRWLSNMRNQVLPVLIHPFFIGTILWAALYFSIGPRIEKYRVELIENVASRGNEFFYQDLDGDFISERIRIDVHDTLQTKVLIYKNMRIIDQYNLHYRAIDRDYVIFFDYDRDKRVEMAVFTAKSDSIFMNILSPLREDPIIVEDRFIDIKGENKFTTEIPNLVFIDVWGKEGKDIFFAINTGHARKPRTLYRYNIEKDTLIKSPESGFPVGRFELMDLNDDSIQEIVIPSIATGNYHETYPFSDQFAWLAVFNRNLEFLFPPLRIGNYPSHLWVQPLFHGNEEYMAVFYDYIGTGKDSSSLMIVNSKGKILKQRWLDNNKYNENQMIGSLFHEPEKIYLYDNSSGAIEIFDFDLNSVQQLFIPKNTINTVRKSVDINRDNITDVFLFSGENSLVITDTDFKNFISYNFPQGQGYPKISEVEQKHHYKLFYLQYRDFGEIIQITENPLGLLQIPILITSWLLISLIILGIFKIQRYRASRIREQEKKISTLQMRAIKNQLDPHFTFNIINAMGGLYLSETSKEISYEIFVKYAKLLRQTLMSSQKINIGLKEELEMVDSYLEIEKLRKDYSFEYKLTVDEKVDQHIKIPRMLIYTFVENAIKHGIRSHDNGRGFIHITIGKEKSGLRLIIENSGPGLNHYKNKPSGTGMGLSILKEMAELYEKLEGRKISFRMDDLVNDEGNTIGVRGEVFLGR